MKRMTDTEIWDKPWFCALSPEEKCAIRFLFDRCDNAGVWVPNFPIAEAYIGMKIDWDGLVERSNENIIVLENGKWWLIDFCAFQYGELQEDTKNKAHQSHIRLLKKHHLWGTEGACMGHTRGTDAHKEKVKAKETVKVTVTETEKDTRAREIVPARWPAESLEAVTLLTFQKSTPAFGDTRGNLDAIPELIRLARARGHPPEEILPHMVDAYFALIDGEGEYDSQRDRDFWAKQAKTPKQMRALWDHLYAKTRQMYRDHQEQHEYNPFLDGGNEEESDVDFG